MSGPASSPGRSWRTVLFDDGRALVLVLLLVTIGGLAALLTMPQEEDPKITARHATVLTPYPGASALRVERLVSQLIEEELRQIEEVDEVRSTSRTGLSSVSVVLHEEVTDNAEGFAKLRDAAADVTPFLPEGAGAPQVIDDRGFAYTVLAGLVWDAKEAPSPLILKRTAEELRSRLRDVPGTEHTSVHGVGPEEVAVTLRPDTAQSLGLSEADIARALSRADAKGSAGTLHGAADELAVEVRGELATLDRVRAVPIGRGDRAQVRVGDVARVTRQVAAPEPQTAMIDGRRGVVVGTRMETGLRVGAWSADVREVLDEFAAELPEGVELRVVFDQSAYAQERFGSLLANLALGVALVVVILLFTLGWRAALIVTAAIPLTALATLMVMNFAGIPLHQMSVTGMIVALGLLVDAAIVTCDAVERRARQGLGAREAVASSVRRLWLPLLSSTATTVLAFLPITLLPGGAGEFVGPIADSVIIALICSYVLALTVVAALAGRFLAGKAERRAGEGRGPAARALGPRFERLLAASLARPRLSIGVALVLPLVGFASVRTLPSQFFPAADRNQFHVQIALSPQSSAEATRRAALRADALLEARDDVVSAEWFVGDSVPAFYYNLRMNQDGNRAFAEAMVTVRSVRGLFDLLMDVQAELERALPDAQVLARKIVQGPPVEAPVELRITGPDLAVLKALGEEARAILADVPDVVATTASVAGGEPKLWVEADEDAARRAGLSLRDVADGLAAKLRGASGGSVVEGEVAVPVVVRLDEEARGSVAALAGTVLTNPAAGGAVPGTPLSALGRLELAPAAAVITRYQGQRVNNVLAYVAADTLPSTAVKRFRELAAERGFEAPPGYAYAFGGDDEARSDAVNELLASVGLIVTATVAVVVLTFGSFRLGALVLVVAALSVGLGILCLAVFRFPFGFQPIIALMGLMGVAINAAIIILSGLKADPAAVAGDEAAVLAGTMETVRHITSTTLTTFAGFLPLILSAGFFWPPFATAIAGGVALSTVVSFFLVPQAFLLLTRRRPVTRLAGARPGAPRRAGEGTRALA